MSALTLTDSDQRRFLTKFRVGDGCWEWTAYRPNGYGRFRLGERVMFAHRVAYTLFVGPIPDGLELDHLCRNPSCVRPDHLEPVTHRENMLRGVCPSAFHAKKTHCIHGHEFTPENTYRTRKGFRVCRTCRRNRSHGQDKKRSK